MWLKIYVKGLVIKNPKGDSTPENEGLKRCSPFTRLHPKAILCLKIFKNNFSLASTVLGPIVPQSISFNTRPIESVILSTWDGLPYITFSGNEESFNSRTVHQAKTFEDLNGFFAKRAVEPAHRTRKFTLCRIKVRFFSTQ